MASFRPGALPRIALAGALLLGACKGPALSLAGAREGAKERVQELFTALAVRYENVHHGPEYDYARAHLPEGVLSPSRVFNDSAVWTSRPSPTTRILQVGEHLTPNGGNAQEAAVEVPTPSHLGDARHFISLTQLAKSEYAWDSDVSFALGSVTAAEIGDAIGALLTAADGRTEAQLRADYRTAFPRSTEVLGQFFSLDTLRPQPSSDGSTLLTMDVSMHPEGLKAHYPAFADNMKKYVHNTRFHFTVSDREGAPFFDIASTGALVTIRLRSLKGQLIPLSGPARTMPDSLVLSGDFTTKVKIFTVGVKSFTSDFIVSREPHERAWTFTIHHEPQWQLPTATGHFIRAPLRRPFEGHGLTYRIGVRDSAGAQTLLSRRRHAEVQESAITHFLSGLLSKVASDLSGTTEREQFAYLASAFEAMKLDAGALMGATDP